MFKVELFGLVFGPKVEEMEMLVRSGFVFVVWVKVVVVVCSEKGVQKNV